MLVNLSLARRKKILWIPTPSLFRRIGQNYPKRIVLSQLIPVTLPLIEGHALQIRKTNSSLSKAKDSPVLGLLARWACPVALALWLGMTGRPSLARRQPVLHGLVESFQSEW